MAKKPKTLKEITIELLEKYEASETCCIWEYSGNIRQSEKMLKKEINKYRKMIEVADRKDESNSEKPNNWEWSVEYAKEMLDTMPCEECGHWEHGAGDHYYCALLEMRQECYFESKGESTLMFANKLKVEPTISKMEQVDKDINVRSKWETPPKFEHKGFTTTCVGVPAACVSVPAAMLKDEPQTYKPTCNGECRNCEYRAKDGNYCMKTDCAWK